MCMTGVITLLLKRGVISFHSETLHTPHDSDKGFFRRVPGWSGLIYDPLLRGSRGSGTSMLSAGSKQRKRRDEGWLLLQVWRRTRGRPVGTSRPGLSPTRLFTKTISKSWTPELSSGSRGPCEGRLVYKGTLRLPTRKRVNGKGHSKRSLGLNISVSDSPFSHTVSKKEHTFVGWVWVEINTPSAKDLYVGRTV